jgi:hypothetical protein
VFTYAKLALIALQIVQFFLKKAHDDKQFAAGEEHQIAEHAKAVLGMTAEGKLYMERINALSDSGLDDLTDAIGSAGGRS